MLKLSQVLKINALSSGVTGLGLVLFAETVATLFEVQPTAPFIGTGIFLILFASFVYYIAIQQPVKSPLVRLIIILDSLWVLGSILAIFLLYPIVSFPGIVVIAAVAIWVLGMAILQQKGLTSLGY